MSYISIGLDYSLPYTPKLLYMVLMLGAVNHKTTFYAFIILSVTSNLCIEWLTADSTFHCSSNNSRLKSIFDSCKLDLFWIWVLCHILLLLPFPIFDIAYGVGFEFVWRIIYGLASSTLFEPNFNWLYAGFGALIELPLYILAIALVVVSLSNYYAFTDILLIFNHK